MKEFNVHITANYPSHQCLCLFLVDQGGVQQPVDQGGDATGGQPAGGQQGGQPAGGQQPTGPTLVGIADFLGKFSNGIYKELVYKFHSIISRS